MRAGRTPAITGIGVESCGGSSVAALWDALQTGRTGLAFDPRLEELRSRCRVSGRVEDVEARFDADPGLSPSDKRSFSRFSQLGYLAAKQAMGTEGAPSGRGGVTVGTGIGPISELEDRFRRAFTGDRPRFPGHAVCRAMPSFLSSFLARQLGAVQGGQVVSLACTSGLLALERACDAIRRGEADWWLVGAIEEDSPHTWLTFDSQRLLAWGPRPGEPPARSCRPFDARALGIVPSGGAAFVKLEALERAEDHAWAAVVGATHRLSGASGASFMSMDPATYVEAVGDALAQAEVAPDEVDLVVPHALSTPADARELVALDAVLGLREHGQPVTTTRPVLGYALAASGLLDVVTLVLQLAAGRVLPNRHIEALAEGCLPFEACLPRVGHEARLRVGVKTAYAFGQGHAAVVLAREPGMKSLAEGGG